MDGEIPVASSWSVRLEQDDIGREAPAASGLGVAGVDEDPMEPRLEPIEVAQRELATPTRAPWTASSARPRRAGSDAR